jgi:hypothetical protein
MNRLVTMLVSVAIVAGALSAWGCAGDPSGPPSRQEQMQIRKDADFTFEKMKEDERKKAQREAGQP